MADHDGDGRADLTISEPGQERVYTLSDVSGLSGTGDIATLATWTIEGARSVHNRFGASLLVTDLRADGILDLVVGEPAWPYDHPPEQGAVYIFQLGLGQLGPLSRADAVYTLMSPDTNDGFGADLGAGDLDGDGDPEILVSSPAGAGPGDAVYIFAL